VPADPRSGNIYARFVEEAYEGRGIGLALLHSRPDRHRISRGFFPDCAPALPLFDAGHNLGRAVVTDRHPKPLHMCGG
jgi:hypothetical protein